MRLAIFFIIVLVVEWYAFQAVRTAFDHRWISRIYVFISVLAAGYLIYSITGFDRTQGQNAHTLLTLGIFLLIYVPKLFLAIFLLGEDILRLFVGSYQYFSQSKTSPEFLPERRKFLSTLALGVAAIPFASLIYGIFQGRYNYKVLKQQLFFSDLPDAFDGFNILHISDIHCGSFDNPEKIQYGIDLINQQHFDLLVFTGDMVNTHATEMDDWLEMFSAIKQPRFGKYSILGNHDYGEYIDWPTPAHKRANFEAIKGIFPKIGFDLLLNEKVKLKKDNTEIHLVGVENWGRGFKKLGDLDKAADGLGEKDFKILLTHDPSHWDLQVKDHPLNFQLTLCGHTHGMQFGIEIPGFIKWSPVQYIYKYWAGLYKELERYIYVNRGFGYHAYPGRVGIWPEITLIELKKK
ncbi:MAG: metallophosphoesterase [Moheibacter sp.]